MQKHKRWLVALIVISIIVVLCVLFIGSWYARNKIRNTDSMKVATKSLLLELKNSGSTNTSGWELLIYNDGSGSVKNQVFQPQTFNAGKLKTDLQITQLSDHYVCSRSVSFGSEETLTYRNRSIAGIDCFFDANPAASLTTDMSSALRTAKVE